MVLSKARCLGHQMPGFNEARCLGKFQKILCWKAHCLVSGGVKWVRVSNAWQSKGNKNKFTEARDLHHPEKSCD